MIVLAAAQLWAAGDRVDVRVAGAEAQRVQAIVDELRRQLSLQREVVVSVVPENPQVVSVRPPADRAGAFHLSFEARFLEVLSEEELRAAIAHELGHVWIFSHHPYLHTERLANDIAMRVVSRESLERVYEKLWARGGAKGQMRRFLGD
jgi:hypothetical protein